MGIKILVQWEEDSEIENALDLANDITEYVRNSGYYSGMRTVNNPQKTFGIILKATE